MDPPKISRWFCVGTAIALLVLSAIVALVQSTELQLGCLLRTKQWGASSIGKVTRSSFLTWNCGRSPALYVKDNSSLGHVRSVQPITQGARESNPSV